jgi:hypothetical protein
VKKFAVPIMTAEWDDVADIFIVHARNGLQAANKAARWINKNGEQHYGTTHLFPDAEATTEVTVEI